MGERVDLNSCGKGVRRVVSTEEVDEVRVTMGIAEEGDSNMNGEGANEGEGALGFVSFSGKGGCSPSEG